MIEVALAQNIDHSSQIALLHAIKGADAIQVAPAAISEAATAIEVTFVSNDRKALRIAQLEALEIGDPSNYQETSETS